MRTRSSVRTLRNICTCFLTRGRIVLCCMLSAVCALPLAGCGASYDAEESTVYVERDGGVTWLDVESFAEPYYDADELGEFVDAAVEEYDAQYGKGLATVQDLIVDDGVARLCLQYKSAEDFSRQSGIEFFDGNIVEAIAAGYTFDVDFVKVEDGAAAGSAKKTDIYSEQDLKVVIIQANVDVQVNGDICYVSKENVHLKDTDAVSIREGYYVTDADDADAVDDGVLESDVYTYIVYK